MVIIVQYLIYSATFIGAIVIMRVAWYVVSFPFKIHHDASHKDQYYRRPGEKFNWNPFKGIPR